MKATTIEGIDINTKENKKLLKVQRIKGILSGMVESASCDIVFKNVDISLSGDILIIKGNK